MIRTRVAISCAVAVLAGAACSERPGDQAARVEELLSPAGPDAGEPFISSDAKGTIHMSWLQRHSDSTTSLNYARLTDGTWSAPVTVARHNNFFVNWADFPSVRATPSGVLYAHWLQRSSAGRFSYDAMVASSRDGARWSAGTRLHQDSSSSEHGFVTLWNESDSTIGAAWLDGRTLGGGHDSHDKGAMQLMHARVGPDGAVAAEMTLDGRTCECCQVSAAMTTHGPVVTYRNRSDANVRDIAVLRRIDSVWREPVIVSADNWVLEGCPVNGPAIDARGDTVVVAWFTGARDTAKVQVAWSTDAGATFSSGIRVDEGTPIGRVDVEMLSGTRAAVSWIERVDSAQAAVRVRRVERQGTLGAPVTLGATSPKRSSGFPRMAQHNGEIIAAWTVSGDTAHIRLARLRGDKLP